ncbi:MAG TPA: hypothetical protein PKW29_06640 [Clostridia bacterium]|nr:hypothetical protein [Clostridia bacterium]
MIRFTGHSLDVDKLLSKQEIIDHLDEYGATDCTLADFREMYNERFGDDLIWLYPISEGNHHGGFFMPVQEGFLWLPYDSADKEDGELIDMKDVVLLEADDLRFLQDGFSSYSNALCAAIRDAILLLENDTFKASS